jgi:hypothetical protein
MIQLQLQPEYEAQLAAEAQARGMALERYVAEKLKQSEPSAAVTTPEEPVSPAARLADLEDFFKEMARYSDKIPLLPDEAFTRESLYQDHD